MLPENGISFWPATAAATTLLHHLQGIRMGDDVSDPQARHSICFRKRPGDDDARILNR
jgi:hypothetical protein